MKYVAILILLAIVVQARIFDTNWGGLFKPKKKSSKLNAPAAPESPPTPSRAATTQTQVPQEADGGAAQNPSNIAEVALPSVTRVKFLDATNYLEGYNETVDGLEMEREGTAASVGICELYVYVFGKDLKFAFHGLATAVSDNRLVTSYNPIFERDLENSILIADPSLKRLLIHLNSTEVQAGKKIVYLIIESVQILIEGYHVKPYPILPNGYEFPLQFLLGKNFTIDINKDILNGATDIKVHKTGRLPKLGKALTGITPTNNKRYIVAVVTTTNETDMSFTFTRISNQI